MLDGRRLAVLTIIFLVAGCATQHRPAETAAIRPNILYIMADDCSEDALSVYGGILAKVAPTPNIDRIGREGMRLENCLVTNSICTPSRACILTGQYSQMNGIYTLGERFDPKHENVAKLLRQAGYQTGMVGKWHLQTDPSGFDFWRILIGQGTYFDPVMKQAGGQKKYTGWVDDVVTDSSLEWLKGRDPAKPFFLMCHFKSPHRPWSPPARLKDKYADVTLPEPGNLLDHYQTRSDAPVVSRNKVGENMHPSDVKAEIPLGMSGDELRQWAYPRFLKDYLRCVAGVDENVGRLLEYLDQNGLTNNTIVIYTSDQGAFIGEHGFFDKRFMYDESLRMPFLVRYPKNISAGSTDASLVINADFAPTFLDYAGVKAPAEMQGESMRKILEGHVPADWRKSMYYRYWMNADGSHNIPAHYGVRTEDYKLIFYYGLALGTYGSKEYGPTNPFTPGWELYDLRKDPHEMQNVYGDPRYAKIKDNLKTELMRLKHEYQDEDDKYPSLMKIREQYWN